MMRIPEGAVLLAGADLAVARQAVKDAQRYRYLSGRPPSLAYDKFADALGMSATGQTDTPESAVEDSGYMSTEAAAEVLNCSTRQVRRLAPKLGGQRIGGRWLLDNSSVQEHREGRNLP